MGLPESVLAVQRMAGVEGSLQLVQHSDGSSILWKATTGARCWMKWHPTPRKLQQEVDALRRKLPPRTPELLAAGTSPDDPGGALVMTRVEGCVVEAAMPPEVWEAAGTWLRELHRLPVDGQDPMPLEEAIRRRKGRLLEALAEDVADAVLQWLSNVINPELFQGAERRVCHRDFMPRNWLWNGDSIGVVDFEHCRPDHPYVDLVKLEAEVWPAHPGLRRAFFTGYGSEPDPALLLALLALHGGTTLEWGLNHGREDFVALGRSVLDGLTE